MSNLSHRQSIIQEKRKKTPRRDFIMEIASRSSLNLYKRNGLICRFPGSQRVSPVLRDEFAELRDKLSSDYYLSYTLGDSFFDLLQQLFVKTPLPYQHLGKGENCDYTDTGGFSKNVYLSFLYGGELENACYCRNSKFSKNIFNSCAVRDNSENIYQSTSITQSFNVFYSKNIHASRDIWLSSDLIGCENCILCRGLNNQKYMIENKQYTSEEFIQKRNEILSDKQYFDAIYLSMPFDAEMNIGCEDVTQSKVVYNIKSGRNVMYSGGANTKENFYDVFAGGMESDFYGVYQGVFFAKHVYCSAHINGCSNIFYSYSLNECSFCLGCIGLKNKSYCILNKQYTKEERYEKVDEILGKMNETPSSSPLLRGGSQLGEFFPPSINPFYFNDTAAYLIDPTFTKEEVTAKGYLRRDEPIKVDIPEFMETVKTSELGKFESRSVGTQFFASSATDGTNSIPSDAKRTIDPSILKKVIIDEEGNSYRIIKMEYDFLRVNIRKSVDKYNNKYSI